MIASTLGNYYQGQTSNSCGRYYGYCDDREIETSIICRPDWLDLSCVLTPETDRLSLADTAVDDRIALTATLTKYAVDRLYNAAVHSVQISNCQLYTLKSLDLAGGLITGSLGLTSFLRYALTTDLLENELLDELLGEPSIESGSSPTLRNHYLPNLESVLNISNRPCSGGPLALCAIARPSDSYRRQADYMLLVQQRNDRVVNGAGRLAVIPKGFHQPLTHPRSEAPISMTILRELEEELFGREEVDGTLGNKRIAEPMHPNRLSEPMRWLTAKPGRLHMECTGFGFNLVAGNFEFSSLVVIRDDEFWIRYGDRIEANWESASVYQYSSLDRDLISDLVADEAWSNEGIFAFLQGLRRLAEIGTDRTHLPAVGWRLA